MSKDYFDFDCEKSSLTLVYFFCQVFQEKISDEAKNLRSSKAVKARKFIDRLITVQKDVQESITGIQRSYIINMKKLIGYC